MTEQYNKLVSVLQEIFMLDRADLDFGIYRIMNQKRKEIDDFLKNRLLSKVQTILSEGAAGDASDLVDKLKTMEQSLRDAGVDPDTNEKVIELRKQVKAGASPEALANEVFSHMSSFFRRYYHQGDFISMRRYKKDVYAIPYEGEEVKLYWANHDQYYIKTSEYFQNYRFKADGKAVSFCLREASTEKDNNKAQEGKNRMFQLCEEDFITEDEESLKIWFNYEAQEKKAKQDALLKEALEAIKEKLPTAYQAALLKAMPTEKQPDRTYLEKHLKTYAARNTFDYFIHKDLGGFLQRELDFYIKNEVLHLDDIDTDDTKGYARQLSIIKAIKAVARPIIDMLAQLENFQKKLWLKKKFVVQSDWCITLDRIDEEFYEDIATNENQHQAWIELFAIDEIEGYTKKLTVDFLKSQPYLVLDTKFFDLEWKYRLLATIDHLDEQMDGLMINSENFQALQLLQERYGKQVKCVYIDPPYNTNSTPILYKNEYKHSSWASLIDNRISCSKSLLGDRGIKVVAIDDAELANLDLILAQRYEDYRKTRVAVSHNPKGSPTRDFNRTHEYSIFLVPETGNKYIKRTIVPNEDPRKMRRWGAKSLRTERKLSFYPIYVLNGEVVRVGKVPPDSFHPPSRNVIEGNEIAIYPIDQNGIERRWNFGLDTINDNLDRIITKEVDGTLDLFVSHELTIPKTIWNGGEYDAGSYGNTLLIDILGDKQFDFPKSIKLVERCIDITTAETSQAVVLDYFSGSGTTGHSVINLNRNDDGQRKFILVEMGAYFDTVTKPRIQKVIYSKDWKNGKPESREGSSHAFKYLRLEGYEDTLNNLQLNRTSGQGSLLEEEAFGEAYMLHYMLDVESRGSLLSTEAFKSPFGYCIQVTEQNELHEQEVDLVETFNYLLGLVVQSVQLIKECVVVQGHNLKGERILIIWRDVYKMDSEALNTFFRKQAFSTKDSEFQRIYVNGDNHLENIRTEEEHWKVKLIEEEFMTRMFDVRDV